MLCVWPRCLYLLIVIIKSVLCITESEFNAYVQLLDDPYETKLSSPTSANTIAYYSRNARELSLQMTATNKFGLPKCVKEQNECQQIAIVGAGAAGLYCGILLAQAGNTVRIYEANNRAGGRIFTYRDPTNPSMYMGEMGAMRLPLDSHPYLNTLIRERYRLNTTSFAGSNDNAVVYINGMFGTMRELRTHPAKFGFNITGNEQGKSSQALWVAAFQPLLQTLQSSGWVGLKSQWDSYSTDSYLRSVNMSQAAIDYINFMRNYASSTYCSVLEVFRAVILYATGTLFYGIEGGNDVLINAMISECQTIDSNRCSIMYSTPVVEVHLNDSNQVQLKTKNETLDIVDTIIIATTAPAANLIKFEKRADFVGKYRALRQVNYICASKVLLFFNVSWWYTQENINGGQSMTDLNLHSVYYSYIRDNQTNGGTIIAAYNLGQSSLIWQSLSESDVFELALEQLIQLHRSSSNIRDYFQGGKVQHWCGDSYTYGALARFLPFQETELFLQLQASVSKVHFIGEHTTLVHGWIEGAIISALQGGLAVTRQQQTIFDVIIIGGDPVGLMTSMLLSLKQPDLRIAIIEKNTIRNLKFHQEYFRQAFDEEYLVQLANMSLILWQQFEQMSNLSRGTVLETNDGLLLLDNSNSTDWTLFGRPSEYLNNIPLQARYPMFTLPSEYSGMFFNQSGYINVTTLMITLLRLLDQNPNVIIRENEDLLSLQIFNNGTRLITDRGILYASRKVLLIPGDNAKNMSHLMRINLTMKVSSSQVYYFRRLPNIIQLPNWFILSNHSQQSFFSGFPIDSTSDYLVIKQSFIQNTSNLSTDALYTEQVVNWVSHHLSSLVNVSDYYSDNHTTLTTVLPDNRILLDYIPRTNKRILMHITGIEMSFAPVWADMLSDMILFDNMNISWKYTKYLDYFSFSRLDRMGNDTVVSNRGCQLISSLLIFLSCLALTTNMM